MYFSLQLILLYNDSIDCEINGRGGGEEDFITDGYIPRDACASKMSVANVTSCQFCILSMFFVSPEISELISISVCVILELYFCPITPVCKLSCSCVWHDP